jgi:transposase
MFYVGAMTPYHHRQLINEAENSYTDVIVNEEVFRVYRTQKEIWGEERTVLVFISKKLKEGQIRGIYADLERTTDKLCAENDRLSNPKAKKFTKSQLNKRIYDIVNSKKVGELIDWKLLKKRNGPYYIKYDLAHEKLAQLENSMGFRIIMTNRHHWGSADIINAYHGQSFIENSFKNIKNPFHLAVTPEFHWTDQKIQVHFFTCVLGFLLATVIWKILRDKTGYKGTLGNLLDTLNNIRLASVVEQASKRGKIKINYQIEQLDQNEEKIASALGLRDDITKPIKLEGLSVYR